MTISDPRQLAALKYVLDLALGQILYPRLDRQLARCEEPKDRTTALIDVVDGVLEQIEDELD
jgi:hypothetical protein